MSRLTALFNEIKEEGLDKWKLENYHKELSDLYALMHLEIADIKKKKALFMVRNPEKATASVKREWDATEEGLREIELKGFIRATAAQLRSLKTRLYSTY